MLLLRVKKFVIFLFFNPSTVDRSINKVIRFQKHVSNTQLKKMNKKERVKNHNNDMCVQYSCFTLCNICICVNIKRKNKKKIRNHRGNYSYVIFYKSRVSKAREKVIWIKAVQHWKSERVCVCVVWIKKEFGVLAKKLNFKEWRYKSCKSCGSFQSLCDARAALLFQQIDARVFFFFSVINLSNGTETKIRI